MVGDTINKLPITLVCKAGRTSICMDNPTLDIFEVPE